MSSSDVGWFLGGAAVGAAVAKLLRSAQGDEKVLIVRDGTVEGHTRGSDLGRKANGRQRWTFKGETVQIFGAATPQSPFPEPLHGEARAFQQVEFTISIDDGTTVRVVAANEGPGAKLHLQLLPQSLDLEFKWDSWRFVLKRSNQMPDMKIERIDVTWANGTLQPFPSPGYLIAEFRKD